MFKRFSVPIILVKNMSGHGYFAHTDRTQVFQEFKSREEWEEWIRREEQKDYGKRNFKAFVCREAGISHKIEIE